MILKFFVQLAKLSSSVEKICLALIAWLYGMDLYGRLWMVCHPANTNRSIPYSQAVNMSKLLYTKIDQNGV